MSTTTRIDQSISPDLSVTASSLPSIKSVFVGYAVLMAVIAMLVVVLSVKPELDAARTATLQDDIALRAGAAEFGVAMQLSDLWNSLRITAAELSKSGVAPGNSSLKAQLDSWVIPGGAVSWAGFADGQGIVRASSGDLLLGKDVSERPWFQQGGNGPYAGDVHDAVLLNKLLGGTAENPLRFLDFAAPVSDAGKASGVLGIHISANWLNAALAQQAEVLKVDLFLLDQSGKVVASSQSGAQAGSAGTKLDVAAGGNSTAVLQTWPDGKSYFTYVVPRVEHGDMPSFGWRLAARVPADTVSSSIPMMLSALQWSLMIFAVCVALLSLGFYARFLAPLSKLARNAEELSQSTRHHPIAIARLREYALLSNALARLQLSRARSR